DPGNEPPSSRAPSPAAKSGGCVPVRQIASAIFPVAPPPLRHASPSPSRRRSAASSVASPSRLRLAVSPSRATSRPAVSAWRRSVSRHHASTCTSTPRVRLNQAVHMLLLGCFSEDATDPFAGINSAAIVDQFYDESNWCIVLEKL
ncbi:hypothetical protein EJB05_00726, partial [Eragrostis curvula]